MRGLDYKWIEALDAVVEQGGFERGAEALFVSQSAISQRIKQLEKFLAQPVLVREQPPQPTHIGKKLLGLYRQIKLLEYELLPELSNLATTKPVQVSIATNADSLATWLLPALEPVLQHHQIEIALKVYDENRTIDKLKRGEVAGAISLQATPFSGCDAEYLGTMNYVCVASPSFVEHYFPNGMNREAVKRAPAVSFDQYDLMHTQFLHERFGIQRNSVINHTVGSSEAFVKLAVAGLAYCLIPEIQIRSELEGGELVNIAPDYCISHKMYWHHWQLETGILSEITDAILSYARATMAK
ncbi:LysR family transcriptional regulator ArgP [Vibrio sp. NTOU-M3]|uniref:LysR family transcriptional regulator ArgP n=1 Tax=Vibrio sp. NTOU-M3 TaxID=3234954 RepID=UPI00349FA525